MPHKQIKFIDDTNIKDQRVLVRADFDVTLNPDFTIADDARIKQNLPTIEYLLKNNNRLICIGKLNRPKGRDPECSLKVVVERLKEYLPNTEIDLVDDFLTEPSKTFEKQPAGSMLVLENIRYYPEEKKNDPEFTQKLAALGDVYINDAFAMCHRAEASVVGLPQYLDPYGGLLLKKEITVFDKVISKPKHPLVAILGGAKINTKIRVIDKLLKKADYLLIGGAMANTFLYAQGFKVGKSRCEHEQVSNARRLLFMAAQTKTAVILPTDVVVGDPDDKENGGKVIKVNGETPQGMILDIGPDTQALFGSIINQAKTIIWNGPVGYVENPNYRRGTDFIYYAIAHNQAATSVVGGGDTLAAISKKEYLDSITHISTGGGAMLEYLEKGTLIGIEALKK